jgi:hypothetical protein
MKSLYITFIALILSPHTFLVAQIIDSYGLKASFVYSQFSITDRIENIEYIEGLSFHPSMGVFVRTFNTESFDLETELLFLQKGASKVYQYTVATADNLDGSGKVETITSEIDINYLQLGINVQPNMQLGEMNVYATIGPSINYLLSVKNFIADEDVKKITFGYNAGLGARFDKIIHMPLFLELKYCGDLASFYSRSGKYWNNVFLINLGVNL